MMTSGQAYRRLGLILIIYACLTLAHSIWLPLHEAPDEVAHFLYSRFIGRAGHLPLNYEEREEAGYLSFWPPVYHAVAAALTGWSDSDGPPHPKFVWESPRFDLARELLNTKRLANTEDEHWPYRGDVLMWHLGRVVSVLFSMGTIVVTFFTALEVWPKQYRLAVWSAAIIAFVPSFIFISSVMSYEPLVGLVTGLYFWVLVRIVKGDARLWNYIGLGLLMGISVTVKYATVILPLEVAGVFAYLAWKNGWGWWGWLKWVSVTGLAAIVASGWWFLFLIINFNEIEAVGLVAGVLKPIIAGGIDASQNYIAAVLTGGQIGTTQTLEIVADPFWAWFVRMYQSFWVREIGDFLLWPVAHLFIGLFCSVAVIGLLRAWWDQPKRRVWVGLLVLHALIFLILPLLRFFVQGNVRWTAQGRHVLFPIATVLPLLLIFGWQSWLSIRTQRRLVLAIVGGLLCWSLVQLVRVIDYPILYLPIQTTAEAAADIPHRLDQPIGNHLVLLGYDLETEPAENALKLKLYWQSPTYVDEDYQMNLALVQDGVAQFNWSLYPLNGRYPTRIWESWETIRDDIWLPLIDIPPGDYELHLQLYGSQGALPAGENDLFTVTEVAIPAVSQFQPNILLPTSVAGQEVIKGATLWQAERYRRLDLPEYRPRMQIPFIWQGQPAPDQRIRWLLVAPDDQVYPFTPVSEHFGYFSVGLDWPSGDYRLRLEVWQGDEVLVSQETEPLVTIVNKNPRLLEPPPIAYPLKANFADQIQLLGYDLPVRSLSSGQGVPLTLFWQGLRTMGKSYTVFTKLLDDQHQVWGSVERLPADGKNTIFWLENEVVIDGFELPVDQDIPDGVYWLNVGFYEEIDGVAVSLPLVADGGSTDVTSITFGPVKIGGSPPGVVVSDTTPEFMLDKKFGHIIGLRGYDLTQAERDLSLTLYWESLAPTTTDYTAFVHVRNQANETVAQMDRPPAGGAYPISLWTPNELIRDTLQIPLPEDLPAGQYEVVVGLYDFATGARLPIADSIDNSLTLSTIEIP